MAADLSAPPALSTPAEHLFEHIEPEVSPAENQAQTNGSRPRSDDDLRSIYEIARTARELRSGKRRRIALQFPDSMLGDAPWVADALRAELDAFTTLSNDSTSTPPGVKGEDTAEEPDQRNESAVPGTDGLHQEQDRGKAPDQEKERIYILADTSYSSCCVDEIAAEHVSADVVVHYGRACLSPTSRLPVVYVFTRHSLDSDAVLEAFDATFAGDKERKVVLMADITYQDHIPGLAERIRREKGYAQLLATEVCHNPLGRIPNRVVVDAEGRDVSAAVELKEHAVFHVSEPPTALLLALASRVGSLHIFPTSSASTSEPAVISATQTATRLLGRRYARVLSLATAGIIGILINTLSVAGYAASVGAVRRHIAAAGKKSYTVVVGRLNPAKLANFAEIDGWVVVGCWESSLVDDNRDGNGGGAFFRPVVTPFELEAALVGDDARIWDGTWWGGIEGVKEPETGAGKEAEVTDSTAESGKPAAEAPDLNGDGGDWDGVDDEESEPPEFDLRTGKLISRSRPMRTVSDRDGSRTTGATEETGAQKQAQTQPGSSGALALRPKSELATVNGVFSPGAEFLRSQRTWQGLGTDFDTSEASTAIEEGRRGVARGYTVGENHERR